MITKIKDGIRVKRARTEFENRRVINQRIAMYQHKKMIEVSKQLREKIKETPDFSVDDYFDALTEIRKSKGKRVYEGVLKRKSQKRMVITREKINVDNSEHKR